MSVKFYRTEVGNEPVREFLLELPREDRRAIGTDIKEVQFGWPLGMPLVRKMDADLWEVRSRLQGRVARVLFTVVNGQMVLLHAYMKKSQRAPKADLETAKARKARL